MKRNIKELDSALVKLWNFEKNSSSPEDHTIGSGIKVWWISESCEHTWLSEIRNMVSKNRECPYCLNIRLLKGFNDLKTRNPNLANEWDYFKNTKAPEDIKFNSNSYAYWICSKGHSWGTRLSRRSLERTSCPTCYKTSRKSKLEEDIFKFICSQTYFKVNQSNYSIIHPYEIDIYIPELKVGFEVNGDYWHSDEMLKKSSGMSSLEYHQRKKRMAESKGVSLYFIWESDWILNNLDVIGEIKEVLKRGSYTSNEIVLMNQLFKL